MRQRLGLFAVLILPKLFGASVAVVTYGDEHCHMVRIPGGWRVYDYEKLDEFKGGTGVEFRKVQPDAREYLVASVTGKKKDKKRPEDYSVNKFRLNLGETERLRAAAEEEWKSAPVAPIAGEHVDPGPQARNEDEYLFRQRAFRKSGPRWALPGDDARISPDQQWIAVQSWEGSDYRDAANPLAPAPPLDADGRFYIDIYNVSTGEKLVSLDGIDRDFSTGDAPLHSTFWLDARYFIVPLGTFREKMLVCDVSE